LLPTEFHFIFDSLFSFFSFLGVGGFELTHELSLLAGGLEAAVSVFGGGIDPLEINRLHSRAGGLSKESFAESDNTLLGTHHATLEHNEVVADHTIAGEASHGVDGLLRDISLGGTILLVVTLANAVDLLVDFGSVMVTVLSSAGNSEGHAGRMPSSNTTDLAETLVSLAGETGGSPTGGDTFESVTLGDSEHIDHVVLVEDGVDRDGLLEQAEGKVDLLGDVSSVNLDFHQMSLLLLEGGLADLGVGKNADHRAVLLEASELLLKTLLVLRDALGILGEGLLLGAVPVLVESTLDLLAEMGGPDGGKSTHTTGSGDVADKTNDDHRGGLNDGDGLNDFLLVHFGTDFFEFTNNVGHSSLVTEESG